MHREAQAHADRAKSDPRPHKRAQHAKAASLIAEQFGFNLSDFGDPDARERAFYAALELLGKVAAAKPLTDVELQLIKLKCR